ncbi:ABC transporter ATP-binding protein [Pigmentibacter sp. JX0631]|uniref:ABC transporter ATP-binding protein n=1 Tax=Pigmentibacter sp. JX0631 TaxID=2976982 RepID=UPI0024684B33|nr:ABC transporter ATP-binding protein [Pigmentibacter sp. JX0631]WGL58737.1 ABC transporter ATP-binding protein [Pigmentibacter sp. JX0631]
MTSSNSKYLSSFQLWIQQIGIWPSQFFIFLISVLIIIPLSLGLLCVTSFVIQTINSTPTDLTWSRLLGEQLALWITPLVEGTRFESSIPLSFQREWFTIIFLIVAFVYGFLNFYNEYLIRHLGEKLAKKLRSEIAEKYLSLNYQSAKKVDAGLLSSMVGEDIRETQQTFTRLVSSIIKDGLTTLILLIWLVILDVQLFTLFVTVLIPAGIVLRVTSKTLKKLSRQGLQFESELLSGILERMRGWQTIQVHKAIPYEIIKFNKINDKIYHIWRRATRAKTLGSPLVEWLGTIAGAFIIIAAMRKISDGSLDSNIFINFMLTVALLSDKINRMSSQLNSTRKGTDALHRIKLFLSDQTLESSNHLIEKKEEALNFKIDSVQIKNLTIANHPARPLVEDINVSLKKGSLLVVIGQSGAGKSTFIRTFLGIQTIYQGKILINNTDISEEYYKKIASKICFIPQDPFIFSGSIFENVIYPKKISEPSAQEISEIKKALSLSLLEKDVFSDVSGLSGGEKQRLMFARIFYNQPDLIIIDEGTSALDNANEIKIIENLKTHVQNAITIVIAHRPAIKEYATDILDFSPTKTSQANKAFSDPSVTKELI